MVVKGNFKTGQVYVDGLPFDHTPSLKACNHSPAGFMWGYGGSGPSQLAFALLQKLGLDDWTTFMNYQDFKWKFIATLPQEDFEMTLEASENFIFVNGPIVDVHVIKREIGPEVHIG